MLLYSARMFWRLRSPYISCRYARLDDMLRPLSHARCGIDAQAPRPTRAAIARIALPHCRIEIPPEFRVSSFECGWSLQTRTSNLETRTEVIPVARRPRGPP